MKMNKFLCSALALAMAASMTVPTFAAGLTEGQIATAYPTDGGSTDGITYNVIEAAGQASSVIQLNVPAENLTQFKVTVPIALHVSQNKNGSKTYADAMNATNATGTAKIINECALGAVQVTDVKVVAATDYTLKDWNYDFANAKVNEKSFAFQINGLNAPSTNVTLTGFTKAEDAIEMTAKNAEDSKTDLTRVYNDYNTPKYFKSPVSTETQNSHSAFPVIKNGSILPIDYEAKLPAFSTAVPSINIGSVVFTIDFYGSSAD